MATWMEQLLLQLLKQYLTPALITQAEDAAKAFVVGELRKFAATTPTTLDDTVVSLVAAALGVK